MAEITPIRFQVFVDDNFHYQDEAERYLAGTYETHAEAELHCKRIVDQCLSDLHAVANPRPHAVAGVQ